MDIINNLTEWRAGTQKSAGGVTARDRHEEPRARRAPPVTSCSPWIGKTQFWGRAARALSTATTQPYPIGPRRSLSTAYWFIDSGVDGNFGRAKRACGRPDAGGISWAATACRKIPARRRLERPPSVAALNAVDKTVLVGQWHRFSPKSALIICRFFPSPLDILSDVKHRLRWSLTGCSRASSNRYIRYASRP